MHTQPMASATAATAAVAVDAATTIAERHALREAVERELAAPCCRPCLPFMAPQLPGVYNPDVVAKACVHAPDASPLWQSHVVVVRKRRTRWLLIVLH